MDVMTREVNELIAKGNKAAARFAWLAPSYIRQQEPSMVVGRPGVVGRSVEDEGRTIVLPLPIECPKMYACKNETGGVTVMLADEY